MPSTIISKKAIEKGTFVITCEFTDEDDVAMSPKTLTWSLVDRDSNIINNREDEVISNPASSEDIVLSGDDLAFSSGTDGSEDRWLILEGTYDSTYGNDLPITEQCRFNIVGVKKVS